MLALGTKIPQLKMFQLEDKRGACREKEGGREEGKEGKRNGGKERVGREAQTSPGLPSPPPRKQNIRALTDSQRVLFGDGHSKHLAP